MDCLSSSHGESQVKYNLMEPIPLQVEHVAVEFTLLPIWLFSSNHEDIHPVMPAISPITGRLLEGRSVLFLPVQVQRTCPLKTVCEIIYGAPTTLVVKG